jgi:hypothetical protein|nr:hypothetical protein [uncultured Lachnoclostridium sp.]
MKKEESMQLTVTLNDYQLNELNKISTENDVSTDTLLSIAVDLYIVSAMGFNDVEQDKALYDFKSYMNKITALYKASMVRKNIKEEMMCQSSRDQLISANYLFQENKQMRDQLLKLNEHKSILEARVAAQADIITSLREKIDSIRVKLD